MKRVLGGLWIALASAASAAQISNAQPTICLHVRMFERTGGERSLAPDEAYPKDNAVTKSWRELGYRVIRPCASAQIQVELGIRYLGSAKDPASKVKLIVAAASGGRIEKAEIPYRGGYRNEAERAKAAEMIGPATADLLINLDPNYRARAFEYRRKHNEPPKGR